MMPRARYSLPDCSTKESIPACGIIKDIVNLSNRPIRVEALIAEADTWYTVVPVVQAESSHMLYNAALWLPRTARVRTVDAESGELRSNFGVVGQGLAVIEGA